MNAGVQTLVWQSSFDRSFLCGYLATTSLVVFVVFAYYKLRR